MRLFTNNPIPNNWVSLNGTVRTQTAAQQELVATPLFQASLAIYMATWSRGKPSAGRKLTELNQAMQTAYENNQAEQPFAPRP